MIPGRRDKLPAGTKQLWPCCFLSSQGMAKQTRTCFAAWQRCARAMPAWFWECLGL